MPKVTFEITPVQRKVMDRYPQVNWSETFRQAIAKEERRQELIRHMEAEANDPLVKEFAARVEQGMRQRWEKLEKKSRRR